MLRVTGELLGLAEKLFQRFQEAGRRLFLGLHSRIQHAQAKLVQGEALAFRGGLYPFSQIVRNLQVQCDLWVWGFLGLHPGIMAFRGQSWPIPRR